MRLCSRIVTTVLLLDRQEPVATQAAAADTRSSGRDGLMAKSERHLLWRRTNVRIRTTHPGRQLANGADTSETRGTCEPF